MDMSLGALGKLILFEESRESWSLGLQMEDFDGLTL